MTNKKQKKVFVGLSGGVDSAVAAHLLLQQGYNVTAVFMQNWDQESQQGCTAEQDLADALTISAKLNIPIEVVNFATNYWDEVFEEFLTAHKHGLTPNPDILCNSKIKFKHFLNFAINNGADFIATGHYAAITNESGLYSLQVPSDRNKDQTYFLHALNQMQLSRSLFPLAHLCKEEVRDIAHKLSLTVHDKKDSTGICFIGNKNYNKFLSEYMLARPGKIVSAAGDLLGSHKGLIYYTIGQRKGIGLGGDRAFDPDPWYVVDKEHKSNRLIVAQGTENPLLYKKNLTCTDIHWIKGKEADLPLRCTAKVRYRQQAQICTIEKKDKCYVVSFEMPQRAVTPGQYIVFYDNKLCLGGAVIVQ